jgi:pimeloyl-ACP methyl ester carboxylesterase
MSTRWVVLPGLAETPEEFGRVVSLLPSCELRLIDPWSTPVTSAPDMLSSAAGVDSPIGLVGHSIGGLAALRWMLTRSFEVDRLILVDTSLTSETGLRWLYPGTAADRGIRALLGFLGRLGVPALLGPAARRLLVRVGSATNRDLLSKATARARYGAPESWLLFWDELASSWALAAEVAALLEHPSEDLPPTVLLVATGGSSRFTANRWLAGQRALAAKLNATVEILPDSAHLVHLDRPDAIADLLVQI